MTNRLHHYDFEWIGVWLILSAWGGSAFGARWIAHFLELHQAPWLQIGQILELFGFVVEIVISFVGFWVVVVGLIAAHAQTIHGLKTIAFFTPDALIDESQHAYRLERKNLPLNTWAFPLLIVTAALLVLTDYFLFTGLRTPIWNMNPAKCVAAWFSSTTVFLVLALATPVSLSEYMNQKRGTRIYVNNEANP